jgi:hypothetical protein
MVPITKIVTSPEINGAAAHLFGGMMATSPHQGQIKII